MSESKPVEWLWYGEDENCRPVISFGRWQAHPCQHRYKYAVPQATEHDHKKPRIASLEAQLAAATHECEQSMQTIAGLREANQKLHRRAQQAESFNQACLGSIKMWSDYLGKTNRERPKAICWLSYRLGQVAAIRLVLPELLRRKRRYEARAALQGGNDAR